MKKAVIVAGGKQYLVTEGQTLDVDLFKDAGKTVNFEPLILIDGQTTTVGTPKITGKTVSADVVEALVKADKVIAIRYKPKKRVHKIRGHRQQMTRIVIKKIS